jgi:hypothetical protein
MWPLPAGSYVNALVMRNDVGPYSIGALSSAFLVDGNSKINWPNFDYPSAAPSTGLEGIILGVAL